MTLAPTFAPTHRSVLLVSADTSFRDDFAMMLRSLGVNVRGVHVPTADQQPERPQVIVLDQTKPNARGHAYVEQLRTTPDWDHVPVVVLGGDPEREGMKDVEAVFPAPVHLDELLTTLQRHCAATAA